MSIIIPSGYSAALCYAAALCIEATGRAEARKKWRPQADTTLSQKNIPDIFDCNLKTNYQILIIFGTNIPDTTCHQMTI